MRQLVSTTLKKCLTSPRVRLSVLLAFADYFSFKETVSGKGIAACKWSFFLCKLYTKYDFKIFFQDSGLAFTKFRMIIDNSRDFHDIIFIGN